MAVDHGHSVLLPRHLVVLHLIPDVTPTVAVAAFVSVRQPGSPGSRLQREVPSSRFSSRSTSVLPRRTLVAPGSAAWLPSANTSDRAASHRVRGVFQTTDVHNRPRVLLFERDRGNETCVDNHKLGVPGCQGRGRLLLETRDAADAQDYGQRFQPCNLCLGEGGGKSAPCFVAARGFWGTCSAPLTLLGGFESSRFGSPFLHPISSHPYRPRHPIAP